MTNLRMIFEVALPHPRRVGVAQFLRRSLTQRDSDGDEASVARTDARKAARLQGYEGLIAAQECLPTNEARDAFAATSACSPEFGRLCRPTQS